MTAPYRLLLLPVVMILAAVPGHVALASADCDENARDVCSVAGDDDFTVIGTDPREGKGTQITPASAGDGASGPPVQTRVAPTCTGNSVHDAGVLCGAALETCPVEGEVRFWKWQRTFNETRDQWGLWKLVDTVCLGADDPQVDPAVAIPGIVQRDFQSVVVMKGTADVTPKPDTLVNIATKFRTDAPASYDIPLTILGQSVVITAKAEKFTWYFGDGDSGVSTEPGGYIEHTYRKAATQQAYVVITWSGTFTVNREAPQAINGTVSTTGNPVDVAVRQARSELVRD